MYEPAYEREGENRAEAEDWMKRAIFLATFVLVLMLVLAPVALAQSPTPTPIPMLVDGGGMPLGSVIALPAAALLLGAGILTYAILRRR